MSHIFDEKIAELTTELDRVRAVNAKLLEACKMAVSGRMSDRAVLIAARQLCRTAIAAAEGEAKR